MSHNDIKASTTEVLFASAQNMGLQPVWLKDDEVFAIQTPFGERYINYSRANFNSQVGASLTSDKFATRVILDRFNLPNIDFILPASMAEAKNFLNTHGEIIAKPVKGMGAQNIHRITSARQLANLEIDQLILERYISGPEMRYLVLNGEVIAVHRSDYGDSIDEMRDLERISFEKPLWDPELVEMSVQISNIMGLGFAAVDFLIDQDGQAYVLEVNAMPGLKWFHAPSAGPAIDVASLFLEAMIQNIAKLSEPLVNPITTAAEPLAS